jgi:hypothetical protein
VKPAASYAARCVAGVASSLDHRDVHAAPPHMLGRVVGQLATDALSLVVRVKADDVDAPA